MNKIAALFVCSLFSPFSIAAVCEGCPCLELDKVVFQVSAKQWVSTQTAMLSVYVNATLTNADLVKARADIMTRLTKIAPGEWHLTQFDRSQDNSGLEKLFVEAQARIPQASLTDIYKSAKDASKPGATYTINSVEFKPSLQEIQQVKSKLRESLYQQVNDELARLNKVYTTQNYSVNTLYIIDGEPQALPQAKMRAMNTLALASAATPDLSLSNEITMSAMVEAASNRQGSSNVANK